jgi:hypothetical protein
MMSCRDEPCSKRGEGGGVGGSGDGVGGSGGGVRRRRVHTRTPHPPTPRSQRAIDVAALSNIDAVSRVGHVPQCLEAAGTGPPGRPPHTLHAR